MPKHGGVLQELQPQGAEQKPGGTLCLLLQTRAFIFVQSRTSFVLLNAGNVQKEPNTTTTTSKTSCASLFTDYRKRSRLQPAVAALRGAFRRAAGTQQCPITCGRPRRCFMREVTRGSAVSKRAPSCSPALVATNTRQDPEHPVAYKAAHGADSAEPRDCRGIQAVHRADTTAESRVLPVAAQ